MSLKNVLAVALGIMSAIGGFVDIGDLVFNTQAGAIFGFQLLWVVVIGVVGIIVYSEMCGRVAAVAKRPVFDLVRERTGFGAGLATLIASEVVNLMTCAAEIGGVAICFQLLSGLPYRLLIPLAVLGLAVSSWVLPFRWIERVFGYLGLGLLVFAVAAIKLRPNWGQVAHGFVPGSHAGATIETSFAGAYNLAQFFGWRWGKKERPARASRFTLSWLLIFALALLVVMTGYDPVKLTEYSVIFSVVALPLTYLPILLVANDRAYLGANVNGKLANFLGGLYFVLILAIAVAAIPLLLLTNGGQG